jgi:subtilisin family serine protease
MGRDRSDMERTGTERVVLRVSTISCEPGKAPGILALLLTMLATLWVLSGPALAADHGPQLQRYIIELHNPPIAAYHGEELLQVDGRPSGEHLRPTTAVKDNEVRLDLGAESVRNYRDYLQRAQESFLMEAAVLLGRVVRPSQVYLNATNGMALELSAEEAEKLAASSLVNSIQQDKVYRLDTDAGPPWIGADDLWNGSAGFAANLGEGVVVGVIDSGINWEHPSFADPHQGYNHVNPFGSQLGLCSKANVQCNNKLVGVYDFIQDDPQTSEVEANTDGRDDDGHGSHVAGIAVGNRLNVTLNGTAQANISGVAPRANLVVYRACYAGEPNDPEGGGCMQSAILSSIDQAITDGVDVINYSIGTDAFTPWQGGSIPLAFLNARNAGIFVATSGGNAGPNPGSTGSPANAPWVVAAGNASHDRIFGSAIQNMSGGATPPPANLVGASLTDGIGVRRIVHAKDFGNALCGTGTSESGASCAANTGASNPWKGQTPFSGEIVVCDRGGYGRIEKGKNVLLAGAGGYILANTDETGNSVVADDHCLPASHIGDTGGDLLRTWLASGSNHMGSMSGFGLQRSDVYGDILSSSSSRGPTLSPVQDILKPNMIAPGSSILSASNVDQEFRVLSGTSMASPHIAGAAALVRAIHPTWTVAQVATALETTSTAALARDHDGPAATPHERGAGRPRLDQAVNAGLYLNVTGAEFSAANPAAGGVPRNLNLPSLVHTSCQAKCSFSRTVTDQKGGGTWTVTTANFPAGTVVKVTPSNFTLANGASRALAIEVDVSGANQIGKWVYGNIVLQSTGSPNQSITTAVYSSGGTLPASWNISDDRDTGSQPFTLNGLVALPDLAFKTGGLVAQTRTVRTVKEDPTREGPQSQKGKRNIPQNDNPYDGGEGVFTVWHNLPNGGLWLHAETLASSADDLDMFVGRDDDGNGLADEEEELCTSTSPDDVEECNLYNVPPGNYWIVVQNWSGVNPAGDQATLLSAAIASSDTSNLVVTGPGIAPANSVVGVRVNWRNVSAIPGDQLLGAVGIGSSRNQPNNLGVIPIRFGRSAIVAPQTFPLFNGETQGFALAGNSAHERMFVDVPPGTTALSVQANGATGTQSNSLRMELYRQDFEPAMNSQPFASLPGGLSPVASANGGSNLGPSINLNNNPAPGRYFVRMANVSANAAAVSIATQVQGGKAGLNHFEGLWRFERSNYQGGEYNSIGAYNYFLWYSFDDQGNTTFYNGSATAPTGNIWVTDMLRYTNDGSQQQHQVVGKLSMTFLTNTEIIFSYSGMGIVGSDTMFPLSPNTCPTISGSKKSYHGTWGKQQAGIGGASVNLYDQAQSAIHYLFDSRGNPKFLLAADATDNQATATSMPIYDYRGYCATCPEVPVIITPVGTFTRNFTNESTGSWTLNYQAFTPQQTVNRTDSIVKISDNLQCK